MAGHDRLAYPANHIEVDNRLSWFLGRLDETFGDDALYVHLTRNDEDTAKSFLEREMGIMAAYRSVIVIGPWQENSIELCLDYCRTVNANIRAFLKDKTRKAVVRLENAKADFKAFWKQVGIEGDLAAALSEWDIKYNART